MLAPELRSTGLRVAVVGIALGALGWILLGRAGIQTPTVAELRLVSSDQAGFAAELNALRASPLFTSSGNGTGGPAIDKTDLRVLGVVNTPSRRAALVLSAGEGAVWVAEGGSFHSYTLVEVRPNEAVFASAAGDSIVTHVFASRPRLPLHTETSSQNSVLDPTVSDREPTGIPQAK